MSINKKRFILVGIFLAVMIFIFLLIGIFNKVFAAQNESQLIKDTESENWVNGGGNYWFAQTFSTSTAWEAIETSLEVWIKNTLETSKTYKIDFWTDSEGTGLCGSEWALTSSIAPGVSQLVSVSFSSSTIDYFLNVACPLFNSPNSMRGFRVYASDYVSQFHMLGSSNSASYPDGIFYKKGYPLWDMAEDNYVKDAYFIIKSGPQLNFTASINGENYPETANMPVIASSTLQTDDPELFDLYAMTAFFGDSSEPLGNMWTQADEGLVWVNINSTSTYENIWTWSMIEPKTYDKIKYVLGFYFQGVWFPQQVWEYNINTTILSDFGPEWEESESAVSIEYATSTGIYIKGGASFYLGDYIKEYLASIQIWKLNATSSVDKMIHEETLLGNEAAREYKWLEIEKDVENGDYRIMADLQIKRKPWWDITGGSLIHIFEQSDIITINIENNLAINPPAIIDITEGIWNKADLREAAGITSPVIDALQKLNPLNFFPFSWIKNFYTEMKTAKDYYEAQEKEALEITIDFPIFGEITYFKGEWFDNILGTSFMSWFRNICRFILWGAFGLWIFKRTRAVINGFLYTSTSTQQTQQ